MVDRYEAARLCGNCGSCGAGVWGTTPRHYKYSGIFLAQLLPEIGFQTKQDPKCQTFILYRQDRGRTRQCAITVQTTSSSNATS